MKTINGLRNAVLRDFREHGLGDMVKCIIDNLRLNIKGDGRFYSSCYTPLMRRAGLVELVDPDSKTNFNLRVSEKGINLYESLKRDGYFDK